MLRFFFRSALQSKNVMQTFIDKFTYLSRFSSTSLSSNLISDPHISNMEKFDSFLLHIRIKNSSSTPLPKNTNLVLFGGILSFLGLQSEDSELVLTIKMGILYIKRKEFERAERVLHAALKIAYEEPNEDAITYIYDVLANLAFDTGQNAKAEKLFINTVQRLVAKGVEVNDNKIIHISLKLAKVYENTKDYKKAESGYKFCIDHLKEKVEAIELANEDNRDLLNLWISALDNYARFLSNTGKSDEALVNFRKAYDSSVQVNGREHEITALLLNDLGVTLNMLGDSDGAISYIKEAIDVGKKLTKMEDLPAFYINLGYLYLNKEMYNESKISCDKGMRIATAYGNDDSYHEAQECLKKIEEVLKGNVK